HVANDVLPLCLVESGDAPAGEEIEPVGGSVLLLLAVVRHGHTHLHHALSRALARRDEALNGGRVTRSQQRLALGQLVRIVTRKTKPAPLEELHDPLASVPSDLCYFGARWLGYGVPFELTVVFLDVNALGSDAVKMDVQIRGGSKSLYPHDHSRVCCFHVGEAELLFGSMSKPARQ